MLDFEASCDENDPKQAEWTEIIEWPCVLIEAASGRVVSEFHQFVRPTVRSQLTSFCTKLTSITQAQVDAAQPLDVVCKAFGEWLPRALQTQDTSSVLPVTCGEPDLAAPSARLSMLPRECTRKGLQLPPVLARYCNIKRPFKEVVGAKPGGMASMLAKLSIPLTGHHHLGIDEARNIAKIALHLHRLDPAALRPTGGVRHGAEESSR